MVRLFISHCSEDKIAIARPLASALLENGYEVWFDEPIINGGDSIFEKINEGLKTTDYGIVIFSKSFFLKRKWPMMELEALIAKETNNRKIIIPIWFNVSFEDMKNNFPLLANRKGITCDIGIVNIVEQIKRVIETSDVDKIEDTANILSKIRKNIVHPYISVFLGPTVVNRGSNVIVQGSTNANPEFVYLNIFRIDSKNPEGKLYKNSVNSDGSYSFEINTYPLNIGQYGILVELPSGDGAKAALKII